MPGMYGINPQFESLPRPLCSYRTRARGVLREPRGRTS